MSDLFSAPPPAAGPGKNDEPWSVSGLAYALKRAVETQFNEVTVRGELGRVTAAASGHKYFDLKDMDAVLNCVWFKGAQRAGALALEQGMEVVVRGKLTTYQARSAYQLIVSSVEPAGIGALLKLIEDRRKKLLAEGLFDDSRKRRLPYLPRTIGIITSPTGAVIQDILHRLRDRLQPHVLLWPVVVQGEQAAAQVIAALKGFNALEAGGAVARPDVIIVARGGGSVEDLMPFNDEALVRAVAASAIPVISAVGHETDTTLIDYASDRRAPTPTAAAEMAVPVLAELLATLADLRSRLTQAPLRLLMQQRKTLPQVRPPLALLQHHMQRLDDRAARLSAGLRGWLQAQQIKLARLKLRSPSDLALRQQEKLAMLAVRLGSVPVLARPQERLAMLSARLTPQLAARALEPQRQTLQRVSEKLEVLSYRATLQRGFAVVKAADGHAVSTALAAGQQAGNPLTIEFADGHIRVSQVER